MVTKWLLLIPVKVKHLLLIVIIVFAIAILYRFKMKSDDGNNTTPENVTEEIKIEGMYLKANIFESGLMPTPLKSQDRLPLLLSCKLVLT